MSSGLNKLSNCRFTSDDLQHLTEKLMSKVTTAQSRRKSALSLVASPANITAQTEAQLQRHIVTDANSQGSAPLVSRPRALQGVHTGPPSARREAFAFPMPLCHAESFASILPCSECPFGGADASPHECKPFSPRTHSLCTPVCALRALLRHLQHWQVQGSRGQSVARCLLARINACVGSQSSVLHPVCEVLEAGRARRACRPREETLLPHPLQGKEVCTLTLPF